MSLTHLDPAGLHTDPASSQGVRIDGGNRAVVPHDINGRPGQWAAHHERKEAPC